MERLRSSFTVACSFDWMARCLRYLFTEHLHLPAPSHVPHHRFPYSAELLREVAHARESVPLSKWSRAAECDQRLVSREAEWMHWS